MTEEPRAIRAALCRLDGPDFAAFVADLWRERGWRVERDGETLHVERDGERRTLVVRPATRRARWFGSVPERADAVVSAAADDSADVDGPELVSMLRYAVPPAATERLCERHFGASPSELALPARVRVRRAAGSLPLQRAGAVAVLLVAAAALAAAGAPGGGPFASGADGPGERDPTADSADSEPVAAGDTTNHSVLAERPINTSELVAAHRTALADRDYLLRITRTRETDLGGQPLVVRETVKQVEDSYLYRTRPENDAGTIPAQDVYSNGRAAFVAGYRSAASPYRYERFDTMPATPREWTVRRLETYLATDAVTVDSVVSIDRGREYEIRGSGIPPTMAVQEYEFRATVSADGFIERLNVEYVRMDGNRGTIEWQYTPAQNAWVEPPAWYERKFGGENGTQTTAARA